MPVVPDWNGTTIYLNVPQDVDCSLGRTFTATVRWRSCWDGSEPAVARHRGGEDEDRGDAGEFDAQHGAHGGEVPIARDNTRVRALGLAPAQELDRGQDRQQADQHEGADLRMEP